MAIRAPTSQRPDEILSSSDRSRVFRRFFPTGSAVYKQTLGPRAGIRFRREKSILDRLSSVPGVTKIRDASYGADLAATHTLVFEDRGGVSLSVRMRSERFDPGAVVGLALELAEILARIHRLGVVHRDLNPANILLADPDEHAILIDFHIASTSAEERLTFAAHAEIEGTLAYIAPEQTGRTGRAMDQRADLYALGATLYEVATGRRPFEGSDAFQLIRDHLVRVPTPPAAVDPGIPPALSAIIMRLLEKEPDQRYQSAEGLAADLTTLRERLERGQTEAFVLREHDFPQRILPPSRLIGRETEIAVLQAAFDDVVNGRGANLLIAGAPGVGKTSLVNELRLIVAPKGGWFVSGKFDRFRRDSESDAVQRAFRSLFRLLLAEPEDDLVAIRVELRHALGPNVALAASVLPELAVLLGVAPDLELGDPLLAQGRLAQVGLDLLRCVASTARPIVFVVDDLQWASPTALRFLDGVMSDSALSGVLLVGAYRVAEVDAAHPLTALLSRWEKVSAPPRHVLLHNLKPSDVGVLLHEMLRLRPAAAERLADAVGSHTGGNPYDTAELINALRRDGTLRHGSDGWSWDEGMIRQYAGSADVLDLLAARIDALPAQTAALLETIACLGGDVDSELLETAADLTAVGLEAGLKPALDDGLIVLEHGVGAAVRFRHDRVQQAAYARVEPQARFALHLRIARRLAALPAFERVAAEQYLAAVDLLDDRTESRSVVTMFAAAATQARGLGNATAAERFLSAAVALLGTSEHDRTSLNLLENQLHVARYSLGRLDEADVIYAAIASRGGDVFELVDSGCVQISSLTNRNRLGEALALGLDLLDRIGIAPPQRGPLNADIDRPVGAIARWCEHEIQTLDADRPEATEPRAFAAAKIINRMMPAAYFCDHRILAWLVLESLRLWSDHGPQSRLVGPISHAGFVTVEVNDDHRIGYRVGRFILDFSQSRGFEPETSQARFLFALGIEHWFKPFENSVTQAHMAREGLLQAGELQGACYTYFASIPLLLQCSATLHTLVAEVDAGIALSIRTGNDQAVHAFLPYRQLARSLRGETVAAGSFTDASFNEETHVASLDGNPTAAVYLHIMRALGAYIFDQTSRLLYHADAAISLVSHITANPASALAHLLRAVAVARRIRAAAMSERPALLAEFDVSFDWLRRRAADASGNFLHMVRLVEAERAWALGDFAAASLAFEAALRDVVSCASPRHRALIAERAARCYLEHGLERYGRLLLIDAHQLYDGWGASAKVQQLEAEHAFLRESDSAALLTNQTAATTGSVSSNAIDMVAILRASQMLSSQTSLKRLKEKVCELLAELTGATVVRFVLRNDDTREWLVSPDGDDTLAPISVTEAGVRRLLPISVFRYVERTREPLLLVDAITDDRFARDPYFAGCQTCSMLIVPILRQGEPQAVLVLENRLGRGAFSTSRLDAVMLIAGQLAVSLDNALLYTSLERKVAERTEALEAANLQLAQLSLTDPLTGLTNRRGFDEHVDAQWRRAFRARTSIGFVMIDVDEFKKYNDHYGHVAGDACLVRVAKTLKEGLRPGSDLVARYGGEEFVLILPDTDETGAYAAAERLRDAVAGLREEHRESVHGVVTISAGIVAFVPSEQTTAAQYLQAADGALYEAKRNGRNTVSRAAGSTV